MNRLLLCAVVAIVSFWAGWFSYPSEHWPEVRTESTFPLPYAPTYLFGTKKPNEPALAVFGDGWRVNCIVVDGAAMTITGFACDKAAPGATTTFDRTVACSHGCSISAESRKP